MTAVLWAGSISSCPLSPGAGGAYVEGPAPVRSEGKMSKALVEAQPDSRPEQTVLGRQKACPHSFFLFQSF